MKISQAGALFIEYDKTNPKKKYDHCVQNSTSPISANNSVKKPFMKLPQMTPYSF
jgi:hypothetical protein